MKDEMMKLPVPIGIALYCDYCYSDYTDVLGTITVPTIVLSSNSGIFPRSIEQGTWIASQVPHGEFVPFEKADTSSSGLNPKIQQGSFLLL